MFAPVLVLFGGAIFMVLGLSLEKFHEARAETLPGGGWGVRRHCLERRARASRNFASSGPRPSEGHGGNAGRNGEGDHTSRREATYCHVPVCQGTRLKLGRPIGRVQVGWRTSSGRLAAEDSGWFGCETADVAVERRVRPVGSTIAGTASRSMDTCDPRLGSR